ncbi:MAG: hypothetical protein K9W44_01330 [Candidatus Lokiarchaeota archaeon]|nr:hypothetical protein [Candidatus Harpocratesius repetitus]
MGILSRLFPKQEQEALKRLEQQFEDTLNKSKSKFICLVGIKGKIKGLDIIYVNESKIDFDKKEMQKINGRLVELYLRYQSLAFSRNEDSSPLQTIIYYFNKNDQICIFLIEGNDKFIITAQTSNPSKILKDLIKIRIELFKLRLEREGF